VDAAVARAGAAVFELGESRLDPRGEQAFPVEPQVGGLEGFGEETEIPAHGSILTPAPAGGGTSGDPGRRKEAGPRGEGPSEGAPCKPSFLMSDTRCADGADRRGSPRPPS